VTTEAEHLSDLEAAAHRVLMSSREENHPFKGAMVSARALELLQESLNRIDAERRNRKEEEARP
jgi:hypothetical protein